MIRAEIPFEVQPTWGPLLQKLEDESEWSAPAPFDFVADSAALLQIAR